MNKLNAIIIEDDFYGAGLFWSLQVTDIAYFYSENKITFAVTQKDKNT